VIAGLTSTNAGIEPTSSARRSGSRLIRASLVTFIVVRKLQIAALAKLVDVPVGNGTILGAEATNPFGNVLPNRIRQVLVPDRHGSRRPAHHRHDGGLRHTRTKRTVAACRAFVQSPFPDPSGAQQRLPGAPSSQGPEFGDGCQR